MKRKYSKIPAICGLLCILIASGCSSETKFNITVKNGTGGGLFEKGETATITATIPEYSTFDYWECGGENVSKENPYTFSVTEDATYTAFFKTEQATITVENGTGGGTFNKGSKATLVADIIGSEVFDHWECNGQEVSNKEIYTFTVTEDAHFVAVYKSKQVTVTVINGTGGGTFEKGTSVTVTATVPQNKEFDYWSINDEKVSTQNPCTFTANENVTITAHFKYGKFVKTTEFTMDDSDFVVLNFADIHVDNEAFLSNTGTVSKTIKYAIERSKPDLLLFSGDLAGGASDMTMVCNYLDGFKIPYFVILGNHDHEGSLGFNTISQCLNQSQYGYIEMGPNDLGSQGNYTIKIKNQNNQLVHGFVMMDTGNKYTVTDDSLVEYVTNPISGVSYGSFNGKKTYCAPGWNGLRGKQIDWYEDTVTELGCETTLVCHIPFLEYCKAYEQYQDAKNRGDQTALAACAPVGHCNMKEPMCGSIENLGLFDRIKQCGSTKNVICGHDHVNDFSLLYEGVRLTYSVKTGEGAYWQNDGSICGYTELTIDGAGKASLDQIYYNPLNN